MTHTETIIAALVAVVGALDVWLYEVRGVESTFSRTLLHLGTAVAVPVGYVLGHVFWPNCG